MNTKKTYDLIKIKGSFDKESCMALWAMLLTRLKQVKKDMIKQKTIIGVGFIFIFWYTYPPTSLFMKALVGISLMVWTENCGRTLCSMDTLLNSSLSRIYVAFFTPYFYHWSF